MSCNCNSVVSPSGEPLPTIADVQGLSSVSSVCCTEPQCEPSTTSEGTTLPSTWLDSVPASTGLTILARVGDKLARFAGSGFLQLVDGRFKVVQSLQIQLSTIWHRWWKPTSAARPILGEPLEYPYLVIASGDGSPHVIKGPSEESAIPYWNATTGTWSNKPLSEIDICRKGLLPRSNSIELVGYAPIPAGGDPASVRCLASLSGGGILFAEPTPSIASECSCGDPPDLASPVTTLSFPDGEGLYTLKFSKEDGPYWSEDA